MIDVLLLKRFNLTSMSWEREREKKFSKSSLSNVQFNRRSSDSLIVIFEAQI